MFSEALNHRSVAHTCTPNSRRRKTDDAARPQPRSRTRMPGRRSMASVSHSVSHREFAPPLTLAMIHSGWYADERGNLGETNRSSMFRSNRQVLRYRPSGVLVRLADVILREEDADRSVDLLHVRRAPPTVAAAFDGVELIRRAG